MTRIGIAMSGGGHRACIFSLGVLMYLADAGRSRQITSIASVSGGSLANAAVGQQLNLADASPDDIERLTQRVARLIAGRGSLFAAPVTIAYLIGLAVLLAVLVGTWFLPLSAGLRVAIFAIGLLVTFALVSLRGRVCARAFRSTLFSSVPGHTRLDQIHSSVDHVLCATDLHAGEHVYFAQTFVCAYRFGLGTPGDLPLHTAVQASAAFPGVFPVAWLRAARFKFRRPAQPEAARSRWLALHDGGVYDNMGDQWAQGLEHRQERWRALAPGFREADELVVVSASAGLPWKSVASLRLPLIGGLLTLLRDKSVLYDNGNSVRRRELVARFDLAERDGRGLRGALVHISQSPFEVPEAFLDESERWPERSTRAQAALALLRSGSQEPAAVRSGWGRTADANAKVATTLVGLGTDATARLLHHAYVLAMVNLHVILDYPLLALPDRERFTRLAGEPAVADASGS